MTDAKAIESIKSRPPFAFLDIVVAIILTLLCLTPLLFGGSASDEGATLEITQNGKTAVYDISQNAQITLDGLTVSVENGEVWVIDSKCPDKVCEHTGKIKNAGEIIVCLPQGVIVKITGESDFDAVTGEQK